MVINSSKLKDNGPKICRGLEGNGIQLKGLTTNPLFLSIYKGLVHWTRLISEITGIEPPFPNTLMCALKQIAFPLRVSGCSHTSKSFMNANKEQIKWPRLSTSMLLEPGRLTQQNLIFRGTFDCIVNPKSAWATQGVIV